MKKILVLSIPILFLSCNNRKESQPEPIENTVISEIVVTDDHNARNSLDYQGTYRGTLPSERGGGLEVILTLSEDTYLKDAKYVLDSARFSTRGKYSWNSAGNVVTLEGDNEPNRYFVEENALVQLDSDGNRITGELENSYILRK